LHKSKMAAKISKYLDFSISSLVNDLLRWFNFERRGLWTHLVIWDMLEIEFTYGSLASIQNGRQNVKIMILTYLVSNVALQWLN